MNWKTLSRKTGDEVDFEFEFRNPLIRSYSDYAFPIAIVSTLSTVFVSGRYWPCGP